MVGLPIIKICHLFIKKKKSWGTHQVEESLTAFCEGAISSPPKKIISRVYLLEGNYQHSHNYEERLLSENTQ